MASSWSAGSIRGTPTAATMAIIPFRATEPTLWRQPMQPVVRLGRASRPLLACLSALLGATASSTTPDRHRPPAVEHEHRPDARHILPLTQRHDPLVAKRRICR